MRIEQQVTRWDCVGMHLHLECLIGDTQREKRKENKDDIKLADCSEVLCMCTILRPARQC